MDELFEMEGQRVGRDIQLIGEDSGREPVGARHDQCAEHSQAHFLGQRGKGLDNVDFFHETTIQR